MSEKKTKPLGILIASVATFRMKKFSLHLQYKFEVIDTMIYFSKKP